MSLNVPSLSPSPVALVISARSILGLCVALLLVYLMVYIGKHIAPEHGRVVEVVGLVVALLIVLDFFFGFVVF